MPRSSQENPNAPRIRRGDPPDYELNDGNVSTAKDFLLRDSDGRCAYSMIHEFEVGREEIHVDHFDPRKSAGRKNHDYSNLLPAFAPCNRAKGVTWPSREAEARGVRFLNPTVEPDYGVHLFEDPESHEIVGATPAGKYHLRYLALNTDLLVRKRRNRALARRLRSYIPLIQGLPSYSEAELLMILGDAEAAIPEIPTLDSTR